MAWSGLDEWDLLSCVAATARFSPAVTPVRAQVRTPKLSQRDAARTWSPWSPLRVDSELPALPWSTIRRGQPPASIVVDTRTKHLYYVPGQEGDPLRRRHRRQAFGWKGEAKGGPQAEWPRWIPPSDMIARWPHLSPVVAAGGPSGGPDNPLGACALYLFQGQQDTLYRIHGTNEEDKIGQSVSSGCIPACATST